MDLINFKVYDPIASLIANDSGSNNGIPTTGGSFTGNVTMIQPAKLIQCEPPFNSCDVTNKQYVDETFLPLAGGTMVGHILQPLQPENNNHLTNKAYVDSNIAPDASDTVKGLIKLTNDLSGTSLLPSIAEKAVTNNKINPGAVNTLKGTNQTSNVIDFSLGNGLIVDLDTINVNNEVLSSVFLPLTGGTIVDLLHKILILVN